MTDDLLGLRGKTVLVTGASGGIGAAIALGFARSGCAVAVHYRANLSAAEDVAAQVREHGGEAVVLAADLTDPTACATLVAEAHRALGGLDVVVNNAGDMVRRATLDQVVPATFRAVFDLNVGSVLWVSQAAAALMAAAGGGVMVNMSSNGVRSGGRSGSLLYAASKAAVDSLTRGLAAELAPARIRVNAIAPGTIETAFHDRHTGRAELERRSASVPLGRAGTPQDCVGTVLYLASDAMSGYLTGETVYLTGGA